MQMRSIRRVKMADRPGFVLRDLVSLVAVSATVLCVQLPSLGDGNRPERAARCAENLRQLSLAWHMYAADNHGRLTPNHGSDPFNPRQTWVAGWLDYTASYDNINVDYLINNTKTGHYGLLGPYLRDAALFRCASDTSQVTIFGRSLTRVRSYAMNNWMGGDPWAGQDQYRVFEREADIIGLAPASAWVIQCEREDSINDSYFVVDMADNFFNFPSSYHNGGGFLTFADGHVEHRAWQDARTNPELVTGQLLALGVPSPGNADLEWLRARSTTLK